MKEVYKTKLRLLKQQFKTLAAQERERLAVCLLKVNLGVANANDARQVKDFLGGFPVKLEAGNLESLIDFLHRKGSRVGSVSIGKIDGSVSSAVLPPYREDQVDTLREEEKRKKEEK